MAISAKQARDVGEPGLGPLFETPLLERAFVSSLSGSQTSQSLFPRLLGRLARQFPREYFWNSTVSCRFPTCHVGSFIPVKSCCSCAGICLVVVVVP